MQGFRLLVRSQGCGFRAVGGRSRHLRVLGLGVEGFRG